MDCHCLYKILKFLFVNGKKTMKIYKFEIKGRSFRLKVKIVGFQTINSFDSRINFFFFFFSDWFLEKEMINLFFVVVLC